MAAAEPYKASVSGGVATSVSTSPTPRRLRGFTTGRSWFPYLLWLPTILVLLGLVIYPTVYLFRTSLFRVNPMALGLTQFVGIGNFVDAVTRAEFWSILGRTGIYAGGSLMLEFGLGIGLAILVANHIKWGQGVFKVLLIAPMMMTPVAVGLVWRWMFDATMGVVNYLLGLVGISGPIWLGGETTALLAVIVVEVWQWTPFVFLTVLAGLSALPSEPFEAARVDGASGRQILTQITLPLLIPVLSVVLVFRFIDIFKSFDIIYVLTEGGPGQATTILPFYIYQQGFRYFNTGFASAISLLLLVFVIVVYSWMLRRLLKPQEV